MILKRAPVKSRLFQPVSPVKIRWSSNIILKSRKRKVRRESGSLNGTQFVIQPLKAQKQTNSISSLPRIPRYRNE